MTFDEVRRHIDEGGVIRCENVYQREEAVKFLVDVIMEKKSRMILDAKTIKDVRELSEPPEPRYTGNGWVVSENSVPEEEMIWWSKTSLRAPLTHEATKRYMELFKQFYGKSVDELREQMC